MIEQLRRGNEAAFEVMLERYAASITSFCRHMVGSREEAEEAVQHTFAAAYQSLLRDERDMDLKPWLYKIARNHCISMLRDRHDHVWPTPETATADLAEHVEQRADLLAALRDVADLPDEQREALLLTEISGLSHQEVGRVLGCPARRVKGLVFRARRNLIEWRDARETPCEQIREQLATLRGTELRRNELRHHLRACPGCRAFLVEVKEHRTLLAMALPVAPPAGLKASVMAALGLGGGSSASGAAVGIAVTGSLAGTTLAKVAIVALAVGGGGAITQMAGHGANDPPPATQTAAEAASRVGPREAGDRLAEAPMTPPSREHPNAAEGDTTANRTPPKPGHIDPDRPGRKGGSPSIKQNPGGEAKGQDSGGGPPAKHGNGPAPAGNHSGKPPSTPGKPPGAAEGRGPAHGPPPNGGGAPQGGKAPGPAAKPAPPVQIPHLGPGDDDEGLGLELPLPVLDLLTG